MSTFDELPHDEARSAAYDGEPFDGPAAPVDPVADAAWAASWGAVGDELRDVAAPPGLLDAVRAAVLDEVTSVAPVRAARPARGPAWRRALAERAAPVLGAAAALVLVVVGIGALAGSSGDDGGSASTAFEADTAAMAAGTGSAASTGSTGARADAAGAAGASPATAAPRALGAHDSVAALAAAYRAGTTAEKAAASGASSTLAGAPPAACGTVLATATLAGRAVLVIDATPSPVVVDAAGCAFVATLP